MNIVLSIAGSDPSAGAGIQQDLKTVTAMGCYGATVITALTSQNTMGVQDVMPVPAEVVASQLQSILDDLYVKSIKIGQLPNVEVAQVVARILKGYVAQSTHSLPIVYDPVMMSTSGRRLMEQDCIQCLETELFPMLYLLTPNIPETEQLTGYKVVTTDDVLQAGKSLVRQYGINILVKGGHACGDEVTDHLFLADGSVHEYNAEKIDTQNLHGTGCTLSSAIAAALANGLSLTDAVAQAKRFVTNAIQGGKELYIGHGNGPLWLF